MGDVSILGYTLGMSNVNKQLGSQARPLPYYSPAYLGLHKTLGQEVRTGHFVEEARIGYDGTLSNPSGELLFTLSEIDGPATFTLRDERTNQVSTLSEQNIPESNTGSFSKAFGIVSEIKMAQSYALKDYANLSRESSLFPIFAENKVEMGYGVPADLGAGAKVVDGVLSNFEITDTPETLYFCTNDIKDRLQVDSLEGLTARTRHLSVTSLALPNTTEEFNSIFKTRIYRKGKNRVRLCEISLANIPMLRWGMPVADKQDPYKIYGSLSLPRNFRWELIFPRSERVLSSAAWNDLEGIQKLIETMQDKEYIRAQQALITPEFFLS